MKRNRVDNIGSNNPSPSTTINIPLGTLYQSEPVKSSFEFEFGLDNANMKVTPTTFVNNALRSRNQFLNTTSNAMTNSTKKYHQSNLDPEKRYEEYKTKKFERLSTPPPPQNQSERPTTSPPIQVIGVSKPKIKTPYIYNARTPTPLKSPLTLTKEDKTKEKMNRGTCHSKSVQKVLDWDCPLPANDGGSVSESLSARRQGVNGTNSPRSRGGILLHRVSSAEVLEEARVAITNDISKKMLDSKNKSGNQSNSKDDENRVDASGDGVDRSYKILRLTSPRNTAITTTDRVKERIQPYTFSKGKVLTEARNRADSELKPIANTTNKHYDGPENNVKQQQPHRVRFNEQTITSFKHMPNHSRNQVRSQTPYYQNGNNNSGHKVGGSGDEYDEFAQKLYENSKQWSSKSSNKIQNSAHETRMKNLAAPKKSKFDMVVEKNLRKRQQLQSRLMDAELDKIKILTERQDAQDAADAVRAAAEAAAKTEAAKLKQKSYIESSNDGDSEDGYSSEEPIIVKTKPSGPPKKRTLADVEKMQFAKEQATHEVALKEYAERIHQLKNFKNNPSAEEVKQMQDFERIEHFKVLNNLISEEEAKLWPDKIVPAAPAPNSKERFLNPSLTGSDGSIKYFDTPTKKLPDSWIDRPPSPLKNIYGAIANRNVKGKTYKERQQHVSQTLQNGHLYKCIKNAKSSYSRDKQLNDYKKHQAYVICQRPVANLRNVHTIRRSKDKSFEDLTAAAVRKPYYKPPINNRAHH